MCLFLCRARSIKTDRLSFITREWRGKERTVVLIWNVYLHKTNVCWNLYTLQQRQRRRTGGGGEKISIQDKAGGCGPRPVLEEATCTYPMMGGTKVWSGLSLLGNKRCRSTHCVIEYKSGKKTPLCFGPKPEARVSSEKTGPHTQKKKNTCALIQIFSTLFLLATSFFIKLQC